MSSMPTQPRHGRWRGVFEFIGVVARRFYDDQCLMRASALAYTSLLSMVPLLALMFAVLKGLGVQHRLEPFLLSRLSLSPETTELIISYIDRTNVSTLGALGAATLIVTVISVLGTIEASFNHIWRVTRQRSLWRQVTDYLSVVLLTPFLLLAGAAITSASQVQTILQWVLTNGYVGPVAMQTVRLSPIFINATALGVLYAVMPNRRPSGRPIVASALLAGLAWYLIQWAYVTLQIGVAGYSAVYGGLAQLPVTLVWLYVSWVVVLGGAEIAAVLELGTGARGAGIGVPDRQAIALHILVRAADYLLKGGEAVEPQRVARQLRLDVGTVASICTELEELGWLVPVEGHPHRSVLARAPEAIVLEGLNRFAVVQWVPPECDPRACRAIENLRAREHGLWSALTLADVLGIEPVRRPTEARASSA
jgi:membrane protein